MQQHPHILRILVLSRIIFFFELWVRVPFCSFFIDSCWFSLILTQFHTILIDIQPNTRFQTTKTKKKDYVDILDFRPDRLEPMVTHRTTLLRRLIGHLSRVLERFTLEKIFVSRKYNFCIFDTLYNGKL